MPRHLDIVHIDIVFKSTSLCGMLKSCNCSPLMQAYMHATRLGKGHQSIKPWLSAYHCIEILDTLQMMYTKICITIVNCKLIYVS